MLACAAFGARIRQVATKYLEAVLPCVAQAIAADVALDGFGATLDVQAGADVAVHHDAGGVYAGVAQPVPFTHFGLVFQAKIVAAPVFDWVAGLPLLADEGEEPPVVVGGKHEVGPLQRAADRLEVDHAPRVDVEPLHDMEELVELVDVGTADHRCDLHGAKRLRIDEVLDAFHGPIVAAGHSAQLIMRFGQSIDGNRYGSHAHFGESLGHPGGYKRRIARHPPTKPLFMCVSHNREKIGVEQRLATCDA